MQRRKHVSCEEGFLMWKSKALIPVLHYPEHDADVLHYPEHEADVLHYPELDADILNVTIVCNLSALPSSILR